MEYAGITIGPIWDTIKDARKTVALWAGSYIFSYVIEKIITAIKGAGVTRNRILIPYHDENPTGTQAGLYPDRIILQADNIDLSDIKEIINSILKNFAGAVADYIHKTKKNTDCEAVRVFIMNYFKVYAVKTTVPDGGNPVLNINSYLDSLELYNTNVQPVDDEENYLHYFLEHIRGSFLLAKEKRIHSIIEIAACGLIESNRELKETAEKKDIDTLLKKTEDLLLYKETNRCYNYIAIIMADGDDMGKTIESLKQPGKGCEKENANPYTEFSRALLTSALTFVREIAGFGGEPVYAGGDDLLFFAPLVSKDGKKTIFNLIEQFTLITPEGGPPMPSISFGISITYNKFPLYEALQAASDLLKKSKHVPKNTVSVRLLTHSGSAYEVSFYKGEENNTYKRFLTLLETTIDDAGYLSSVRRKILQNRKLLDIAGKNYELISNFFTNTYNEDVHYRPHHREYLDKVKEYIHYLYTINSRNVMQTVDVTLRLIELYKQKGKL